jgi:hypothetical protein
MPCIAGGRPHANSQLPCACARRDAHACRAIFHPAASPSLPSSSKAQRTKCEKMPNTSPKHEQQYMWNRMRNGVGWSKDEPCVSVWTLNWGKAVPRACVLHPFPSVKVPGWFVNIHIDAFDFSVLNLSAYCYVQCSSKDMEWNAREPAAYLSDLCCANRTQVVCAFVSY